MGLELTGLDNGARGGAEGEEVGVEREREGEGGVEEERDGFGDIVGFEERDDLFG